jgi:hypothetical protein
MSRTGAVTVTDLVLRYESDVLIRIQTLEEERAELIEAIHNEDGEELTKDLDDQIAHWKATLTDIQNVIERDGLRRKR